MEQGIEAVNEKVTVFEESQNSQIDNEGGSKVQLAPCRAFLLVNQRTENKVRRGDDDNQYQQFPIPEAIKEIAGGKNEKISDLDVPIENQPVKQIGDYQKETE